MVLNAYSSGKERLYFQCLETKVLVTIIVTFVVLLCVAETADFPVKGTNLVPSIPCSYVIAACIRPLGDVLLSVLFEVTAIKRDAIATDLLKKFWSVYCSLSPSLSNDLYSDNTARLDQVQNRIYQNCIYCTVGYKMFCLRQCKHRLLRRRHVAGRRGCGWGWIPRWGSRVGVEGVDGDGFLVGVVLSLLLTIIFCF
ncbi:hypothetical protein HOLleu_34350 [Holothuria leucospilota]|uniref:Uncharacterized protein n=1 Tax=Holothuria leucospilota TaxID=206669 RepID=A0A9Q1BE47_HOLLE|nr:hypothetical protein HOLleu_34350 [Holothuria leucospilota]